MNKIQKSIVYTMLAAAAISIHPAARAQAPGFYDDTEDTLTIPLDGGMTLLVAGGLLIAGWWYQSKRNSAHKNVIDMNGQAKQN